MSELKAMQRLTADVTIDLDPELVVPNSEGSSFKLRSAIVHMKRQVNGRWDLDSVTGNGCRPYAVSGRNGWRKAYYHVKNFEVTPELQKLVDEAVDLVRDDCRKAN